MSARAGIREVDGDLDSLRRALASHYVLERPLGAGGAGVVYLARDIVLDRPVAIKLLPTHFAGSDDLRERYLSEARMAARMQHPNIVPVFAVEELGPWIVIAMAYVDGGTLADRLRSGGPLAPRDVAHLVRDVALALAYAHRRGVVHRDVKPENILLDRESGRAMIADFGIAQLASAASSDVAGTPHYMSPEQIAGGALDGRSDLYSLGVLAYRSLTGQLPFEASNASDLFVLHLATTPPPLRSVSSGVPDELARIVDRCLAKEAAARFQTGEQLGSALDTAFPARPETPVSLAQWASDGRELTMSQTVAAPLLCIGIWFSLDFFLNPMFPPTGKNFDADVGMLVGVLVTPLIYLLRRQQLLRRAARAGFGVADLRNALKSRDDVVLKTDANPRGWMVRPARTLALGGCMAVVTGIVFNMILGSRRTPPLADWSLFVPVILLTVGALVEGSYGLLRAGRRATVDVRRTFWDSRFGAWAARLLTAGVRRHHGTPALGDRVTELALGSAVLVLFDALPRTARKRLGDLPAVVHRLEAAAQRQRRRVAALDENGETAAPRLAAEKLLRDSVSALELFRLDLARLHAKDADVESITADLESALDLSRRIQYAIEGVDEVSMIANAGLLQT